MKNLFLSMFFLLSLLFFLANIGDEAIPSGTVDPKAAVCVGFAPERLQLRLLVAVVDCNSLLSVKTVDDKKSICRCLKAGGKSLGVQDRFLSKIPDACNIKVGFPVSTSTNCETIH